MWFFFGIVSLVAFTIYFGKQRYESSWEGIQATTKGLKYTHQTNLVKEKVTYIQVGCLIATDSEIDFSIKPETKLDKFFKFIGVSVEHQVGTDRFDNALYIISDHEKVCEMLSQSSALQNELIAVLGVCKKHSMKLKGLYIRNQRIWVRLVPLSQKNVTDSQVVARDMVPQLNLISDLFKLNLAQKLTALNDPFYFKAAVFLAISTGMAVMGQFHLVALWFTNEPFILSVGGLFSMSLVLGTILIVALTAIMFAILGRTSRTHIVLIELLTIGYFGAVSSTFTLARDINIEWDTTAPKEFVVQLHNKTISRSRRSRSYYIYVDDWLKGSMRHKKIKVSSSKYHDFNVGDKLEILQHPGYLGFKWASEIKSYSHDF